MTRWRLVVGLQGLNELVAHRVDGVEAGHGVLENHGHLVSPEVGHLILGKGQHVLALKGNGPADDLAGGLQKPDDRIGLHALAGAGLAHDAHDLAVVDAVRNAAHRLDLTGRGEEGDVEVLHFQQLSTRIVGGVRLGVEPLVVLLYGFILCHMLSPPFLFL